MPTDPLHRLRAAAAVVAADPVRFTLFLAAVNGLFLPYEGIAHDARLYAAQTLNRVDPGSYSDDLFFRYGSQDRFSAFSALAAPVVRLAGLDAGFALLYLVGGGLYLFAAGQVVRRVAADPVAAAAAGAVVAGLWLPFGAGATFHVFESFVTPRLFAVGLTLLAVDGAASGRWVRAAGLLTAGLALHPLMAFGGVLLVAGMWATTNVPWRWLVAAGTAGGACLGPALAVPAVGERLFGTMDAEWRESVRRYTAFNFTSAWAVDDWARAAGSVAVLAAAARSIPGAARPAGLAAGLGVLAVAGTGLAEALPYALPFQGQPYRALWLIRFLAVPYGMRIAVGWGLAPAGWRPVAGVGLAAWLAMTAQGVKFWVFTAATAGLFAVGGRDWGRGRAAAAGVAAAWAAAGAVLAWLAVTQWHRAAEFGPAGKWRLALETTVPLLRAVVAAGLLLVAARSRAATGAVGLLGVLAVAVFGPMARTDEYRRLIPHWDEVAFVRDHLAAHPRPDGRLPCVYWPGTDLSQVWFDLPATCYANLVQTSGVMFSPETAAECRRRLRAVGPFEAGFYQMDETIVRVVEIDPSSPHSGPPTAADLRRLCEDPAVDWAVLPWEFPEFAPATNGVVWAYDARAVRARP